MGIPIKGSRRLELEGAHYRWLIRRDRPRRLSSKLSGCRVLTVQRVGSAGKPEGQIFQAKLYSKTWVGLDEDEDRADDVILTPEEAKQVVRLALAQGWSPESNRTGVFTDVRVNIENWETAAAPKITRAHLHT